MAKVNELFDKILESSERIKDGWLDSKKSASKIRINVEYNFFKNKENDYVTKFSYFYAFDTRFKEKFHGIFSVLFHYFSWKKDSKLDIRMKTFLKSNTYADATSIILKKLKEIEEGQDPFKETKTDDNKKSDGGKKVEDIKAENKKKEVQVETKVVTETKIIFGDYPKEKEEVEEKETKEKGEKDTKIKEITKNVKETKTNVVKEKTENSREKMVISKEEMKASKEAKENGVKETVVQNKEKGLGAAPPAKDEKSVSSNQKEAPVADPKLKDKEAAPTPKNNLKEGVKAPLNEQKGTPSNMQAPPGIKDNFKLGGNDKPSEKAPEPSRGSNAKAPEPSRESNTKAPEVSRTSNASSAPSVDKTNVNKEVPVKDERVPISKEDKYAKDYERTNEYLKTNAKDVADLQNKAFEKMSDKDREVITNLFKEGLERELKKELESASLSSEVNAKNEPEVKPSRSNTAPPSLGGRHTK